MAQTNTLVKNHGNTGEGLYPFTDTATLQSNEDTPVQIPSGMFADAIMYAPGGNEQQYISTIVIQNGFITVTVSDAVNDLCSGTLDLSSEDVQLVMTDTFGRPCGLILGNSNIAEFAGGLGDGKHTFNSEATELVSTCVVPQPQVYVDGFVVGTDLFAADVWLVGKNGVALELSSPDNALIVNVVGDPLFVRRSCEQATLTQPSSSSVSGQPQAPFTAPRSLQKIHVINDNTGDSFDLVPDEYGSIFISPGHNQATDNVFRADQLKNGLKLRALGNVLPNSGT